MIFKGGTGFWSEKSWASGGVLGVAAASLAEKMSSGTLIPQVTDTLNVANTISGSTSYGGKCSYLTGSSNTSPKVNLGLPDHGFEIQSLRQGNIAVSPANLTQYFYIIFSCNNAGGVKKWYVLGSSASNGLILYETNTYLAAAGSLIVADTLDNRTNDSASVFGIWRLRVYKDGSDIKVVAVLSHTNTLFYDVVKWTIPSDGNGFQYVSESYTASLTTNFTKHSDISIWELEASDISGGYAASDNFQPFARYLPIANKTDDVEEHSDPSNDWTDLNGANVGAAWGAITDGAEATGNIMGANEVGLKTKRSIQAIANANGYTCSAVDQVIGAGNRLADDDGEDLVTRIGRVSDAVNADEVTHVGIPSSNVMLVHVADQAALTAAGITKDSTDVFFGLKQVS